MQLFQLLDHVWLKVSNLCELRLDDIFSAAQNLLVWFELIFEALLQFGVDLLDELIQSKCGTLDHRGDNLQY